MERLYTAREALGQTGLSARNAYIFTSDADAKKELDIVDQQKAIYLDALNKMEPLFKGNADFDKVSKGLRSMAEELNRPGKYRDAGKMEEFGKFLVTECSPLRRQIVVTEITAAGNEQSSGIEQVNEAIVQMDKVTQQNAALVEQAAAAAALLKEQADTYCRCIQD